MTSTTALTVRFATAADAAALVDLARLDSARPLTGDVLVAEAAGRAVAALSLTDGRTVADPFVRSADPVALLRVRAAQATRPRPRSVAARGEARLGTL